MLDRLESRRLMSAVLENGILRVTGTDAADVITISTETLTTHAIPPTVLTGVVLTVNGQRHDFSQSNIRRIRINTLGGDDKVTADFPGILGSGEAFVRGFRQVIHGGDGNDTIFGGDERDLIRGGKGNDNLSASSRGFSPVGDRLVGGPGDDLIFGSFGPDTILAGNGHDKVLAEDGNDRVFGGPGDDDIDGADGADRLLGGRGDDLLSGGRPGGIVMVDASARAPDDHRDTLLGGPGTDTAEIINNDRLRQIEIIKRK